jgi:hypothetical protein
MDQQIFVQIRRYTYLCHQPAYAKHQLVIWQVFRSFASFCETTVSYAEYVFFL